MAVRHAAQCHRRRHCHRSVRPRAPAADRVRRRQMERQPTVREGNLALPESVARPSTADTTRRATAAPHRRRRRAHQPAVGIRRRRAATGVSAERVDDPARLPQARRQRHAAGALQRRLLGARDGAGTGAPRR
eukprot:ctg_1818.g301